MAERIDRGEGLTASERYLKRLCEKTFLSLWSYPNLHKGPGDELCDLLVVFDNDVIIFSDKSCAFPDTGNLDLDWKRWFNRSIERSAKQALGAERWLRQHPDKVFLDARCTRRLPIPIPSSPALRVHRIVVALGAADRCREEMDGSGSLLVVPRNPQTGVRANFVTPFTVGWPILGRSFVHVLDEVSLDIILRELDTVSDFIDYLREKEDLIGSDQLGMAYGEEELFAAYLNYVDPKTDRHGFPRLPDNYTVLWKGVWDEYKSRYGYGAKRRQDIVSYVWDFAIEKFAAELAAGTLDPSTNATFLTSEAALRAMASENRYGRRILGDALDDILRRKLSPQGENVRLVQSPRERSRCYVFCIKADRGVPQEEYRKERQAMMWAYALAAHHKFPEFTTVVVLGAGPGGDGAKSEDLYFVGPSDWTPATDEAGKDIYENEGLLNETIDRKHRDHPIPKKGHALGTRAEQRLARNEAKRRRQILRGKRSR